MVIEKCYHLFSADLKTRRFMAHSRERRKNRPDSRQLRQYCLPIVSYKCLDCSWMFTFRGRILFSKIQYKKKQCEHTDHKAKYWKVFCDIVPVCVCLFFILLPVLIENRSSGKENTSCLKLMTIMMQVTFRCEFLQMVQTKHEKGRSPGTPAAPSEGRVHGPGEWELIWGFHPFCQVINVFTSSTWSIYKSKLVFLSEMWNSS